MARAGKLKARILPLYVAPPPAKGG